MSNKSPAVTIDVLTQIWQRVLKRSPIGPEEEFIDLGGSDSLADRIFAEIAQVSGRDLPSAMICHAPTIEALSALLEQPTLPHFSPLVQLKRGSEKPPIFITHGLGGRVRFSELAKNIRTGNPIYGIQAKGVDGMEEPLDRIEDMAQFYLDALGTLQPQGSYILIGYSFGGLVALEMAQRLCEDGKDIELLVLMDTYPHPRYLSRGERVQLIAQRARRHLSDMKKMPIRGAFSYVMRGLQRRLHIAGVHSPGHRLSEMPRLSFAQTTAHVQERAYVAYGRYRPRFYRGRIKFVRAEVNSYFPNDPAAVWGKLADEFEVETVPGGHLDIVEAELEGLAAVLTRYVKGSAQPLP